MSTLAPEARSLGDLPRVRMDGEAYRSIGFLRAVQIAVRRHGRVIRLELPSGAQSVLLGDAAYADAWRRNSRHLHKEVDAYPAPASLARMILDDNLTTAREGEEWQAMRAQVAPLMRYKMPAYPAALRDATAELAAALVEPDERRSLWTLCGLWSARTVCGPVMGTAFDGPAVLDMVNGLRRCMFHLVQRSDRTEREALLGDDGLLRLRARLDAMVERAVATARPGDETMVATLLARRGLEPGAPLPRRALDEMRPVLVGALAASVHNNSLALFWTLAKLARHPAVCDAIAREARDGAGWSIAEAPTALAALREALRIHPVLPFMERRAARDLALGALAVPRGTTVVFSPWVIHRDPAVWPDPLRFDPGRFPGGGRLDLTCWFPFGLGHRACIGSNLALSQIAHACTLLCRDLQLAPAPGDRPAQWQPTYRVLLEPRIDGARLVATPRHAHRRSPR